MKDKELKAMLSKIDRLRDAPKSQRQSVPDGRDGAVYQADKDLKLAVKLALTTGRPLLLRGKPGSGKSSLAAYVARNLGWRYFEVVVTSRTQAQDLQWKFDAVRRLADATNPKHTAELRDVDYVEPGVLWWVFNPESAKLRGADPEKPPARPAEPLNHEINKRRSRDAVVLLDEIDKADPDVPNDLLVPLGSSQFKVFETNELVEPAGEAGSPATLVIITTNEERQLPQAFVRRCVVHRLQHPDPKQLVRIARRHLRRKGITPTEPDLAEYRKIAERVYTLRKAAEKADQRAPSTAEFLDAIWAERGLGRTLAKKEWKLIEQLVLIKE